jgi:uncharacterized protein
MRGTLSWLRSHPWRGLLLTILLGFLSSLTLLNVLAYRHARAMTHFVAAGRRTGGPQSLSLSQKLAILFCGVQLPHPSSSANPQDRGLDYTVHAISGRRGKLEAWFIPRHAARGVVLFFHGYGECKAQLLPEAGAINAMGYSCFLVDFPGCGGSEGDETTIGFREADDVEAAINYVREECPGQPLALFGRSMGSAAILRALGPNGALANAAVLECPFDRMLSTVQSRFTTMGVPPFPGAQLLLFWGGVQLGFNGFAHNPSEYAVTVKCPVLLLSGDKDPNVSTEQTAAIFKSLAGPKALHTFAGLAHEPYLGRHPAEWQAEVSQFLDSRLNGE